MNLLGIDLGDKKTGLSYNIGNIVFTLESVDRLKLIKELKKIIIEKKINTIVVGLPYDLYNKDLRQLEKTKKFIDRLKDIFPEINMDTIDERFTTFESYNILGEMNFSKEEKKQKKDAMSAYLILESYINKKNKQEN
ncbi:MAG: Holliday junction resolvase RuvX [Candidatus Gracilibacteria bacterium]|nr:Holliday junction resolvase RuvX [Candidatus Gracilibacteria bacterium]